MKNPTDECGVRLQADLPNAASASVFGADFSAEVLSVSSNGTET
jgi:hypothetical protein